MEHQAAANALAQQAFLARAALLEAEMQRAREEMQLRLDAMARILALADPHEQLAEYLALRLSERQRESSTTTAATDVTRELLECARRLPSACDDSDAALLAAFFFSCDAPPAPRSRGVAPLLPVVAAMMERAATTSLDHPVLL